MGTCFAVIYFAAGLVGNLLSLVIHDGHGVRRGIWRDLRALWCLAQPSLA
jgi:hypothetical protein